jgi:membrane-bound lytic murein transglycosylase D
MKLLITLFTVIFTTHSSFASQSLIISNLQDTVTEVTDSITETIDEVLRSKTLPNSDKVQHVNQVTKYGFKSLFNNLSYNPSMPYSSQVSPYAESYMQDYLQAYGSHLQKMKGNSQMYFNLIDNIFSQYGLPKELKYLAVIESDLKSQALSWMGARGPWQFMPYTAKGYGLLVNDYIDERTDYYKSTNAAARYLLSLYKDLKDWLLVIAAYNGGPGTVYSAIRKSGSRNFWSLQYYLPTESRNHVKKFIATHYIMEGSNSGSENFNYATLNNPSAQAKLSDEELKNTEVLTISGKYNSVIVAESLEMDISDFNRLNPGLDAALASGSSYDIRLSPDKMDLFVANKYAILNECVQVLLNDVNTPEKTIYSGQKVNNIGKRK